MFRVSLGLPDYAVTNINRFWGLYRRICFSDGLKTQLILVRKNRVDSAYLKKLYVSNRLIESVLLGLSHAFSRLSSRVWRLLDTRIRWRRSHRLYFLYLFVVDLISLGLTLWPWLVFIALLDQNFVSFQLAQHFYKRRACELFCSIFFKIELKRLLEFYLMLELHIKCRHKSAS